jgi:hypothetical protein
MRAVGREAEVDALVLLQEAAVAQRLLALCAPPPPATAAIMAEGLRDVRNGGIDMLQCGLTGGWGCAGDWDVAVAVVCEALHQLFVDTPAVLAVVHAQGYPVALLEKAVAGIPSLRMCASWPRSCVYALTSSWAGRCVDGRNPGQARGAAADVGHLCRPSGRSPGRALPSGPQVRPAC